MLTLLRPALVAGLIVAVLAALAAPAAAHYPQQHDSARISLSETLIGGLPDAPQGLGARDCENGMAGPYPCKAVDLESFLPLPVLGGATGNDVWGWTDRQTGREYAIIGTSTSTGFVDVTDPEDPRLLGTLPTRGRPDLILWRDVKVIGHHALIVSEITDSGLQVFDLHRLRDASGATPEVFTADATYDEFSSAHNIAVNEDTGYAYVVGSDTCEAGGENGGLHMVDVSNPVEPAFAGCATVGSSTDGQSDNYVHDVECVVYEGPDAEHRGREICFGSNESVVAIYDVTDKENPRVLSTTTYPQAAYTHQGTLAAEQRYFLFGDELDEQEGTTPNTTTYVLDVSDLDAPPQPAAYLHASQSIDHNMYTARGSVFQSNYAEGLRILDYDRASLAEGRLEEVAFFDVVPGVDVAEFAGTWSNFRFKRSGTVVVSAIENEVSGLFVLAPQLGKDKGNRGGRGAE